MIVNFVYPTTGNVTGGEAVLYEFANGLSRLGATVNFLHGPAWPSRIDDLADLPEICLGSGVHHHLIDALDDAALPEADIFVGPSSAPRRLGLPVTIIQGYKMLSEEWERESFVSAGLKVCVATWLQDVGAEYGVAAHRLVHVPPGIDHQLFARSTPLSDRSIDALVLHHPFPEKGWSTAEAMLEELVARRPDLQLAVFGRRDPRPLPTGVTFLDSPDHARLAKEIYADTRIFVQTSRNEGFGLTSIEAMGCGAALVTTDCGGSRDYGRPGETADVVPAEDPAALADAVIALSDDEPRRLRYASNGEQFVRRFDWELSAADLLQWFQTYVENPEHYLGE